jgi:hypothetical protein
MIVELCEFYMEKFPILNIIQEKNVVNRCSELLKRILKARLLGCNVRLGNEFRKLKQSIRCVFDYFENHKKINLFFI